MFQNHEEFRGLERAKEAMVDVAQYINEVKRDSEVLALLAKVQVCFQYYHYRDEDIFLNMLLSYRVFNRLYMGIERSDVKESLFLSSCLR